MSSRFRLRYGLPLVIAAFILSAARPSSAQAPKSAPSAVSPPSLAAPSDQVATKSVPAETNTDRAKTSKADATDDSREKETLDGSETKTNATNPPDFVNGIGIGTIKIYDERLLTNMLVDLEEQLATINAINAGNITAGLGKIAGSQISSSQVGLTINALPTAERSVTETIKSGGEQSTETSAGSTGTTGKEPATEETASTKTIDKNTDSADTATTIKTPSTSPQPAALPQGTNVYSSGSAVNLTAQSLLTEQINLSSQVMNLRMLLTRALSDRFLILGGSGEKALTGARGQTVVGLRVTIDSMRRYRNAVAEIEIRLGKNTSNDSTCTFRTEDPPGVSLMLPREKSYNVASITRSAASVGFGAIVQVVNVGFSMSRSRETMYIVQDYDTVALERTSSDGREAIFAWQFRPTLGRAAVEPGQRDVFALLSLPAAATCRVTSPVKIRSYWRKYDKKSGTVGDVISDSMEDVDPRTLDIPSWMAQENALRPKITAKVDWTDAGVAVVGWLEGEAYLPGTQIIVGDRVFSPVDGSVVVQSDSRLRFTLPALKLAQARDAILVSNFGIPKEVRAPDDQASAVAVVVKGFAIAGGTYEAADPDRVQVKIELRAKNTSIPYKHDRPVVLIGDRLFGMSDAPVAVLDDTGLDGAEVGSTLLQFRAPADLVKNAEKVRVLEFFKGPHFQAETRLTGKSGFAVTKADIVSKGNTETIVGITGVNLTQNMSVEINGKTFSPGQGQTRLVGKSLLVLSLRNTELAAAKRFIVVHPDSAPTVLAAPGSAPQPATPEGAVQETVHVNDSVWVTIKGAGLDEVTSITFESSTPLEFEKGTPDDTLRVRVTREVTEHDGAKDLLLRTLAGKTGVVRLKVVRP